MTGPLTSFRNLMPDSLLLVATALVSLDKVDFAKPTRCDYAPIKAALFFSLK